MWVFLTVGLLLEFVYQKFRSSELFSIFQSIFTMLQFRRFRLQSFFSSFFNCSVLLCKHLGAIPSTLLDEEKEKAFKREKEGERVMCVCSCFHLGCVDLCRVILLFLWILCSILSVRQGTIRSLLSSSISLPLFLLLIPRAPELEPHHQIQFQKIKSDYSQPRQESLDEEKEKAFKREKEGERERESVCVCVCACVFCFPCVGTHVSQCFRFLTRFSFRFL